MSGPVAATWTTQQLVAFLAEVSACRDAESAARAAAEAAAMATESEVGAVVIDGRVVASVGYPPDDLPFDELVRAAGGAPEPLPSRDGDLTHISVATIGRIEWGRLVTARRAGEYESAERGLLRAMATVLGLTLDLLRTLEAERRSRAGQEAKTRQVSQLLAHARMQRQQTLERISAIQRAISSRRELTEVLDAITEAACELLESDMAELRLTSGPNGDLIFSARGIDPELAAEAQDPTTDASLIADATRSATAVIENDLPRRRPQNRLGRDGAQAAMAVPVRLAGEVVGGLVVATRSPRRTYGPPDEALASTLAEHAALALQDASTVAELQQTLAQAMHQAQHDSLTGLSNRGTFLSDLDRQLAVREAPAIAVMFVDLDHFKAVNDTRGHAAGDRLLQLTGRRLISSLRPGDHVARMGGDEFAIMLRGITEEQRGLVAALRVFDALTQRADLFGEEINVGASVGLAVARQGDTSAALLARADLALYEAKRRGRGQVCLYHPGLEEGAHRPEGLGSQIRDALEAGQIAVRYQPVFRLGSPSPIGLEALAHWDHPDLGPIPPEEFLRIAEEAGVTVPIGHRVLSSACTALSKLRTTTGLPLTLCVNLSPQQIRDEDLPGLIATQLVEHDLEASDLVLEVTESVLKNQVERALARLLETGVRFALDGFGTGDSSLSTLRRLPMDWLKIDKSLVARLHEQARPERALCRGSVDEAGLVQAVIGMGAGLGLRVVAQGVETQAQLDHLRGMGCEYAQGALLAPPMGEGELVTWLSTCADAREA
jgi:diguanylate cyclase (GGDEF)-like protein